MSLTGLGTEKGFVVNRENMRYFSFALFTIPQIFWGFCATALSGFHFCYSQSAVKRLLQLLSNISLHVLEHIA